MYGSLKGTIWNSLGMPLMVLVKFGLYRRYSPLYSELALFASLAIGKEKEQKAELTLLHAGVETAIRCHGRTALSQLSCSPIHNARSCEI